ncbi:MAG: carbon storage regulator [Actinomycetes bacterium]
MHLITRHDGEGVVITMADGSEVRITVLDGTNVCLGVDAPKAARVERTEVEASRLRHPSQPHLRAV